MPSEETKRRLHWGKPEWIASAVSLVLIILTCLVWPLVLEREFKAHLLKKAKEGRTWGQPYLNVFPTDVDKDGFATSFYMNYTEILSGRTHEDGC